MKKAITWLFQVPPEPRAWWRVIAWWEIRRIPYNLIVGIVGIISLCFFYLFIENAHELKPGEDAVEPMALFVAPFFINFAYTAGWISELVFRSLWREKSDRIGPLLLKLGLTFSLFMALFPSVTWFIIWLYRALRN